MQKAIEQAHGHTVHAQAAQLLCQSAHVLRAQWAHHFAPIIHPLRDLKTELPWNDGSRSLVVNIIDCLRWSSETRNFQHITKTCRGDKRGGATTALDQRISGNRCAM